MLWFQKLKEGAKDSIKEHPFSVVSFFVSFLCTGILSLPIRLYVPALVDGFLVHAERILLSMTPYFLVCESNFLYKRDKGKCWG